jgi:hypothetical protein
VHRITRSLYRCKARLGKAGGNDAAYRRGGSAVSGSRAAGVASTSGSIKEPLF